MTPDLLSGLWTAARPPRLLPSEWELLLAQAGATRLSARLALHFQAQGWSAAVPERVWQHLQSATRYDEVLRRDVMQEVRHLARALARVETPVVLLKGAAYLAAGLPPARGRLFSDIDILVHRDQLRAVEMALFAAGWIAEKLKPYDDRYYRLWMHELPPMQHVRRRTHLDVHHTLAPPTSRFVIDGADMLARSLLVAAEPNAAQLRILAPTDLVLHSALHLMQEGEFHSGLRDLLDIRDLLIHFGQQDESFWPALADRARVLGLHALLSQVLGQLQRLFAFSPPPGWDRPRNAALLEILLSRVLAPPDPTGEALDVRLARLAMYVRSHWLRMPWYRILPHIVRKAWARLADRHGGTST